MTRVASIAAFVLLFCFVASVMGACTLPSATSIANQPVLDSTPVSGTAIVENTFTHVNSNDSRLLQLSVNWAQVENRTVSYVGLGASASLCSSYIHDFANGDQNGWTISNTGCVTNLFAQYTWPNALYDTNCATVFRSSASGDNFTVSFSIYIHFEDYVPTTRAGEVFYTTQSSQVIIPVILVYPKSVDVNLTNIRVFALSSITIDVSLTSQTVENTSPFNVKFDTFVGRSFAISPTANIAYFNGSHTPASQNLTADGADTFVNATGNITRAQHWNIAIVPGNNDCQFDGYYLVNVNIYWTGVDSAGNTLPSSDNPIPLNTTASFGFQLASQSFCGVLINNSISAVMQAYILPPGVSGHGGQDPHTGFIEEDTIYFRAAVESLNLPVASVTLTELRYTPANGAAVVLVTGGSSPVNAIQYSAPALPSSLANETNFQFKAAHSVFNLGQDTSVLYVFDATLTVTYATGLKRNINVRQSSATAGTAKASTSLTIQRAAVTSSASSLTLGMFSAFIAAIYLLLQ